MAWAGSNGGKGGSTTRGKVKDPSKAVWIGNVPAGVTFQELLDLAREVGDAKWAEVFKGSAAVGFESAEEAAGAAVALNGAVLGSAALVADIWEKKTPTTSAAGKGSPQGGWGKGGSQGGGGGWTPPQQPLVVQGGGVWLPQFQKKGAAGGGKGGGKAVGNRQRVKDPSKAVWVGSLPEGTTYQELLDLAKQVGDAKWAEIFSKGSGAIGFGTAEDAETAAVALNGAILGSAPILADAWEKKQR